MKNLTMIAREYDLGMDKKTLEKIYKNATSTKQGFLMIDLEADQTKRFRKNFDELYAFKKDTDEADIESLPTA